MQKSAEAVVVRCTRQHAAGRFRRGMIPRSRADKGPNLLMQGRNQDDSMEEQRQQRPSFWQRLPELAAQATCPGADGEEVIRAVACEEPGSTTAKSRQRALTAPNRWVS